MLCQERRKRLIFSSRRRHTRYWRDWSSDVCSSDLSFLVPLALAFFPILASAGAIAGAEERGTMDVLLSNPIPRWQLVAGSFAATGLSLLRTEERRGGETGRPSWPPSH